MKLPWYEFFAGGGMARLGLGKRHWSCVFANDNCPKKAAAYGSYFKQSQEFKCADIADLTAADLPGQAALAWASFPCQDLSLAGNGAGLNGSRSGTFWPFWKLMRGLAAEDRAPTVIVLENVVGAITSHGGADFQTIASSMSESGYRCGALVIDAVHFLPQSRPRLFVVGVRKDVVVPTGLQMQGPSSPWHIESLRDAYETLPTRVKQDWVWWHIPTPNARVKPFSALVESTPSGVTWHSPGDTRRLLSLMSDVNRDKVRQAQASGQLCVGTVYRRTRPLKTGGKAQRAEVRFDDVAGCLRTPAGGSSRQILLIVEGESIRSRLLSPREAARLMGVPEKYPLPQNYNDAYHLLGDGLAVPVVKWVSRHLLLPLATARSARELAA